MKIYVEENDMIYNICSCPKNINIPTSDEEAYDLYENYHYIYNKLWLYQSQDISSGTYKDTPLKTPVIVKPQFYKSTTNRYIIKYVEDIPYIPKNYFWTEILEGKHYSIDIFYYNNEIEDYLAFEGIYNKKAFQHWELMKYFEIFINLRLWIRKHMKDFNGIFNIRLINDKILNINLHMKHLNYLQGKCLTQKVICHYQGKGKNIKINKLPNLFIIPVIVGRGYYKEVSEEEIIKISRYYDCASMFTRYYQIHSRNDFINKHYNCICTLVVTKLDVGLNIRDMILERYYSGFCRKLFIRYLITWFF